MAAIVLLCTSFVTAGGDLSGWDKEVLDKANTASGAVYLSKTEKQVIFYMNLCRMNPQLFMKTLLRQYLDSNYKHNNSPYAADLITMLKKLKPRPPLKPSVRLSHMAARWAAHTGKTGETGHGDFDERFKGLEDDYAVGENCDYGSNAALTIVMDLLIDEGEADVGHRKNILDPDFEMVGVSIKEHKVYGYTCVMDFRGEVK